jgi:large subunit ribosomal protein L15
MLRLDTLTPLVKKRKRVGRGGSRGGTSGKGSKGQKARSGGYVAIGFEGGQMPLYRRLPKRGFTNARFKIIYQIVSLDTLDKTFNDGDVVNRDILVQKGLISASKSKKSFLCFVKVLGTGTLSKKLVVHAEAFSKTAEEAIKGLGGEVHILKEM